jgi:hypothetical protein
MKQRDIFTAGVRLIGVWLLVQAISDGRTLVDIYLDLFRPERVPVKTYWIIFVQNLLVGLLLTLFAHRIAQLVYGFSRSYREPQE